MNSDPAIQRTRDVRRQISTNLGNDPAKLVQYYIEMQKRFGARLRHGPVDRGEGGGLDEYQGLPPDPHKDAPK